MRTTSDVSENLIIVIHILHIEPDNSFSSLALSRPRLLSRNVFVLN